MAKSEHERQKLSEQASQKAAQNAMMRRRNLVMLGVVLGLAVLFFVITIVKMSTA
jgi:uncharacterized membrane protein